MTSICQYPRPNVSIHGRHSLVFVRRCVRRFFRYLRKTYEGGGYPPPVGARVTRIIFILIENKF